MKSAKMMEDRLLKCKKIIREKTNFIPEIAIVLGSGLGNYAEKMEIVTEISYTEIEGFPVSTVAGHDGKFLFGYIGEKAVVMMKGRVHYYEGYEMEDVVLPIRLMKMLGAKTLILTNAAGGIDSSYVSGDLMLIEDQITSFVSSPLRGQNLESLGTRFPDMSSIYDQELKDIAKKIAHKQGLDLKQGVYLQTQGPNYESPAEIKMYAACGAHAVGMSTACEAVAAKHMGMKILGISCISNMAAGILDQPLNHLEVQETANKIQSTFEKLISGIVEAI